MMRWRWRMFWLGVVAAGGYSGYRARCRRQPSSTPTPQWPPLPAVASAVETVVAARWVAPVEGHCPEGYPVKANHSSGIFHTPGGRFYARTAAERCYANADDAVADGYRPAKA